MSTPAEVTTAGTRSTSGDGTAVLDAPAENMRYQIVGAILIVGTPGTDAATVTIKSGETTKAVIPLNTTIAGFASPIEIACGYGEAVYLNLSANVTVHWTLSYYLRDSGRPA